MKRMGNKGQGAMEYLMTYGWAILVVMIVGVVLWQLGIFKIGQTSTTTSGWTKLAPLSSSIVFKHPATFSAQFNNLNGVPIRIKAATGSEVITGKPCNPLEFVINNVTVSDLTGTPVTVGAGDTFVFSCNVTGAAKNAQDTYSMGITITYDSVLGATSTEHTETGTVQGPAE